MKVEDIAMPITPEIPLHTLVAEWQIVTVASLLLSSIAAGIPTMLDRPTTTALLPLIGIPQRSSSSMQPRGVQGTKRGSRP